MDKCLYVEMCAVFILILSLIICSVKRQYAITLEDKLFLGLLWAETVLFVCDGGGILIESLLFPGAKGIRISLNLMFFSLTGVIGFMWLVYMDYKIYENEERLKERIKWYGIPLAALIVLTFSSPWTGWIFLLNPEGICYRGKYHVVPMMIFYGYLLWAVYQAGIAYGKTDKKYLKIEYSTRAYYIVFPILGGILQEFVYGFPLIWSGTAISILVIFFRTQNQKITKDGLTGINNRRYLNQYLGRKISNRHRKEKLFLVLMDIDSFKEINDTYGHIEGDAAIIRVAGWLKEVCWNNNDFLARYGGDEFAIVCEREDCREIENLLQQICAKVSLANETGDTEYEIWLSIGYAELGECKQKKMEQLIDLADQRLYEVKRKRKEK